MDYQKQQRILRGAYKWLGLGETLWNLPSHVWKIWHVPIAGDQTPGRPGTRNPIGHIIFSTVARSLDEETKNEFKELVGEGGDYQNDVAKWTDLITDWAKNSGFNLLFPVPNFSNHLKEIRDSGRGVDDHTKYDLWNPYEPSEVYGSKEELEKFIDFLVERYESNLEYEDDDDDVGFQIKSKREKKDYIKPAQWKDWYNSFK